MVFSQHISYIGFLLMYAQYYSAFSFLLFFLKKTPPTCKAMVGLHTSPPVCDIREKEEEERSALIDLSARMNYYSVMCLRGASSKQNGGKPP